MLILAYFSQTQSVHPILSSRQQQTHRREPQQMQRPQPHMQKPPPRQHPPKSLHIVHPLRALEAIQVHVEDSRQLKSTSKARIWCVQILEKQQLAMLMLLIFQFPSIGDADRREKEDKVRAEELRKTQLEEAAKRAARAEERAKNVAERNAKEAERAQQYDEQAKQREENQMANQKRREQSEQEAATRKAAEEAAERKKIEEKVNSGKYVPPVQRRRLAPGS